MTATNLKISIKDLNQHPECIPLLAAWHHQQWHNSGHDREALISSRTGADDIPQTFVAMCGETPVGFVCLLVNNAPSRPDLTPWLAYLLNLNFVMLASAKRFCNTARIMQQR
jgi:hypothetical protein